ncbi:MAG: alpha/beta hydrolase [Acidimicrobiales bacterium]
MSAPIIPGAEPESIEGGPNGALVVHGFTGNPSSMRGIAHALAAAGFTVELPLLPGHGTSVADMQATSWSDWLGAAEDTYQRLAARVESVVIVGLSMGGAITCWLAAEHPEVAGIVAINAVVSEPPGIVELVQGLIDDGQEVMGGIGSDVADPAVQESAYPETPLRPLLTMAAAAGELQQRLGQITCPVLVLNSPQDHVVTPDNSDILAASVAGPVERVTLERSYHVATVDFDRDLVERCVVDFARKVV